VALAESHSGRLSVVRHVEHISERMSSNYVLQKVYGLSTDTGYVLEWVMKGTHDRSSRRLQATGLPFSVRGVSVGELKDGRIVRNTDYWNVAELLNQIRVTPVLA
jgi:SnoaL-like polyketide cyclase